VRKIWVVIRREFVERVRTKWFLISTVLGPVFMAAMLIIPVLVGTGEGRERSIAVVDVGTNGFAERLTVELDRSQPIQARRLETDATYLEAVIDSLSALVRLKAYDGFLVVTGSALEDGKTEYFGTNVSSPRDMQTLSRYVQETTLAERLTRAGVDPGAVRQARLEVQIRTSKVSGIKGARESGEGAFVLAYAMWFVLYIAIIVYGVTVMGAVVEEKTSRVIEVLVSSVRPFQLLAGKVAGVGAVGLFQMLIWGVCGSILLNNQREVMQLLHLPMTAETPRFPHLSLVTSGVFLSYFLLGYFLYAAMFAAIASMSSSESEARQAQTPVVMLLIVPTVLMIGILNDPNGPLARTLGLIPFFSPIAMPVRWAAAPIPMGELALSLAVLAVSVVLVTWIASRIYRVGILMYGKRPSLREVARWIRAS
jgi:ABC-2 type transport system permease protein